MDELNMARKRDHKIMITEEAIAKVPLIEFREIPKEHYGILQNLAKEVLRISKDENNSNEVAITYSLDAIDREEEDNKAEVVGVALGSEHSVNPEEDTVSYHILNAAASCVVVVLHNHPSLSKLSLSDVQFFLMYRTMKLMIVVTNLGSVSYIVKMDNYDREAAINLYDEAVLMNEDASNLKGYQNAADHFMKNCYKCGIIYDDRQEVEYEQGV